MGEQVKVAVVGATGYGGVELIRLLQHHPRVRIASVVSTSSAGAALADNYPHLTDIVTEPLDPLDIPLLAGKADVVFLATPHGVSTELTPQLLQAGLKVIDISGDFRLKAGEVYEQWYKRKPAPANLLQEAVYGLVDVFGSESRDARLIANPGCYPTAALLGLIPALAAGWIDPATIIIDAKSGVSGAGRSVSLTTHFAEVNENLAAYKVNRHQHTPEIEQTLSRIAGRDVVVTFTTHLVPMTRGIMCTSYGTLTADRTDEDLIGLYKEYYKSRRFVRIRGKGKWPATKEVWGSNYCDIGFSVDPRTKRLTIVSVIDNLVKGAAGQAIQNLNLMMGWDDALGLEFVPAYP